MTVLIDARPLIDPLQGGVTRVARGLLPALARAMPMDNGGMSTSSRLSDRVAERLRALISERGLRPGDRLPAERALAVELGISRTSLREAIARLASQGLLTARVGGGTYVHLPTAVHAATDRCCPTCRRPRHR